MRKSTNVDTGLHKNIIRARIIGHSGQLLALLSALGSVFAPSSNYPTVGTLLILISFALVPFTTIISATKNLERAGQANLNALVFSVLFINLMASAVIIALVMGNQLTAAIFSTIILAPYIYLGLRILISAKNNIIIGSGPNPVLRRIWLIAAFSFMGSIVVGLIF